jgi:hypothetical protein
MRRIRMKLVIDRFEDGFAVCENLSDQSFLEIERRRLPGGAKEGTVLVVENGADIVIDEAATRARGKTIREKMERLWE